MAGGGFFSVPQSDPRADPVGHGLDPRCVALPGQVPPGTSVMDWRHAGDVCDHHTSITGKPGTAWRGPAIDFPNPLRMRNSRHPLQVLDGLGWLGGNVRQARLLCLAAGGGRQGPLYAAAGALVTVVDISAEQLAIDRAVAAQRNLRLRTIQGSMDDLSMLPREDFDIVIHPVSTCYLPDVGRVFREVAAVLKVDGLYISQHKSPTSLQMDWAAAHDGDGYRLHTEYYCSGPLPAVADRRIREPGTLEYLHRWEELIGGMCRAGFVVEDLAEPFHAAATAERGHFGHRSRYAAPYVRIKSRRCGGDGGGGRRGTDYGGTLTSRHRRLWIPD